MADFMTNYGIIFSYILLAVAVLAAIIFPLINLIQNPKNMKGALIGLAVAIVVIGISYALASDVNPSKIDITPQMAKEVGTGLYAFYILGAVAVLSLVYSEVSKIFK